MTCRILALLGLACLAFTAPVDAQCSPTLHGFQTGPLDVGTQSWQRSIVYALMPYSDGTGSSLIAAGQFALPPFPYAQVARYQDGSWTPMPMPEEAQLNQQVVDLAEQDFSSVGGPGRSIYAASTNGDIYRWTGSDWTSVGSELWSPLALLATVDAQGPVLLLGRSGGFNHHAVMAWRGSGDWVPYGTGLENGFVGRLRVIDDGTGPAVFALGAFVNGDRGIRNVAKFADGNWVAYSNPNPSDSIIADMTMYDDGTHGPELYVSSAFSSSPRYGIRTSRLRGGEWESVGSGSFALHYQSGPMKFFKVNEGDGEKLYIGGYLYAGQQSGLFELTADGWQAPLYLRNADTQYAGAVLGMARVIEAGGDRTLLAGDFSGFSTSFSSWNGSSTRAFSVLRSFPESPLGYAAAAAGPGELTIGTPNGELRSHLSPVSLPEGPRLLLTGAMERAGGQRAMGAALFDGHSFSPLSLPSGATILLQNGCQAMIDGEPRLVASGHGGTVGVYLWDGSQWSLMIPQPFSSHVKSLVVLNGMLCALTSVGFEVYSGGVWTIIAPFSFAAGAAVADVGEGDRVYISANGSEGVGIYQFDGETVTLFAPGDVGAVQSLVAHDDGTGTRLYIGPVPGGVARFNGTTFEPLPGVGMGVGGGSFVLSSYDDGSGTALYAAGNFLTAGGHSVNGFARWRDNQWEPVTPYVPPVPVTHQMKRASFAVFNDRLYLAGDFTSIGGVNADHLAWIEPCPSICDADYNRDGEVGTDPDIDAFFRCLAGFCCARCTSDFNGDGDSGTDQDIESFFRVLGGGSC